MQLIVDGLVTNYERLGKGPQIVVLHGWADSLKSWQPLARHLSDNYELILLDLPGFGGSAAPVVTWGLSDYARFVAAFLNKAGFQPKVMIGHSNGGAMAIRGIAQRDFDPEKLVLLASAGVRGEQQGRNRLLNVVAKTGKVVAAPLPTQAKRGLRQKLYRAAGSDMLVAEHMQETFKRVVADDIRADAAKLRLPTLLVYGENDTATPPQYGEMLQAAITGSRLVLLPDAGHFLQVDQPQALLATIKEFLS